MMLRTRGDGRRQRVGRSMITEEVIFFRALCSENQKVFQRGASPRYGHFPSETILVMIKYQKLAKSVEGN